MPEIDKHISLVNALDAALAFRALAVAMDEGRAVISEPQKAGDNEHP